MRRGAATAALVLALVLGVAPAAVAHAVLVSSDPGDLAVLEQPPAAVTLRFSEVPEPGFSSVQVLDGTGRSFAAGRLESGPGSADTVRQALRPLPKGVYTVNWRVVSRVDGHLTTGSFAFGVGEPVTEAAIRPAPASPGLSPTGAAARTVLYAGLALLLGGAWVGLLIVGERRRGSDHLLVVGWVATALGLVALTAVQLDATGASLGTFLGARAGRAVLWQILGLALAGAGLVAARTGLVGARTGPWRSGHGLVAAGAAIVVVAHVEGGHAAAASWPWAMVSLQTLHAVAALGWLGGLAALLVVVARQPGEETAAGLRRFSLVALMAIGVVAATGVMRAIDEVGAWAALFDSTYGRLVLVKASLLVVIAALGAVNRYRHVPAADASVRGLRRVGVTELAVAGAVLVATGLLTTAPPPAGAALSPPDVVVAATDFGTTVRARLAVSPGAPGRNTFTVTLTDYDTGDPVPASGILARFDLPTYTRLGETSLRLPPGRSPGTFTAAGNNLSLPGRWRVTLVVEQGAGSVELDVELAVPAALAPPSVAEAPGQPTIYTVDLGQGRSVQVYGDPGTPGANELHVTFFAADGTEEDVAGATVDLGTETSSPRRLGPGHFVADVDLPAGGATVEVSGVTQGGDYLFAPIEIETRR